MDDATLTSAVDAAARAYWENSGFHIQYGPWIDVNALVKFEILENLLPIIEAAEPWVRISVLRELGQDEKAMDEEIALAFGPPEDSDD